VGLSTLLLAVTAISSMPVAVLATLSASGVLAGGPALVGVLIDVAFAAALALIWQRDLARLGATLRAAAQGEGTASNNISAFLPPHDALARETERLARVTAERAAEAGRLRRADEAILERLPDPLIIVGADRAVRRTNEAARVAFGGDIASVLRHPILRTAIDRALAQYTTQEADLVLPVPILRELHATVIVLDPPLGDGGAAVAVLSDRSRERAVERMRADFVANASHELRTPLASLIGFIDTLRGPAADDPPAQARFLEIMAEQAARMNRLIDDLLSLSRIELTEHQAPADRVDVGEVIERIAAGFEPTLAAKRIALNVAVQPDLPPVAGDADQLAQVVQNLLDNAVKYGKDGGQIRLSAGPMTPDGHAPRPGVVVSITDDGPGIAREHIPRLTERFYRVDTGRSRAVGGTGLGLAIVKHIVNRHRGQLFIESRVNEGSTFSVWLPAAR
jgi:two-component system phosphate regulon sensor histidine kinase PhoR